MERPVNKYSCQRCHDWCEKRGGIAPCIKSKTCECGDHDKKDCDICGICEITHAGRCPERVKADADHRAETRLFNIALHEYLYSWRRATRAAPRISNFCGNFRYKESRVIQKISSLKPKQRPTKRAKVIAP